MKIGGKKYSVKFKVVGVDISKYGEKKTQNLIKNNKDIKNNYVRLERLTDDNFSNNASYTDYSGDNTGFWSISQINENKGTTVSHEHNHSLNGLEHPEEIDPKGGSLDQVPSIEMTAYSYNFVKPEYQGKNKKGEHRMDVTKRKVLQKNIDSYFTPKIKNELETKGKASSGKLKNKYHEEY